MFSIRYKSNKRRKSKKKSTKKKKTKRKTFFKSRRKTKADTDYSASTRSTIRITRKLKNRNICKDVLMNSGDFLGAGKNGRVYQYDNRVVKFIISPKGGFSQYDLDKLFNEFEFAKKIGSKSIGPKVYETGVCPLTDEYQLGYIIMQKLDEVNSIKSETLCSETVQGSIVLAFYRLSKLKIANRDNNPHNVMYKNKKLYLIDMGMAYKTKTFEICTSTRSVTVISRNRAYPS